MRNQFGQEINPGDWVGYISRHGSTMTRKVGLVIGFSERTVYYRQDAEPTVLVSWRMEGTYRVPRHINEKGTGVGVNTLFKLDLEGLACV